MFMSHIEAVVHMSSLVCGHV